MSRPSLAGCWAKVERSREHSHHLQALAQAFLKRRPNQIRIDYEGEPEMVTLRITSEPMPLQFSTVGGDAIQNLRVALDLLAFQLVLLRVPAQRRIDLETPGTHTAFPIFSDESEFEARVRKPAQRDKKSPLLGLDVISPEWAVIESFQPYKRRGDVETDELAILASFSNRTSTRGFSPGFPSLTVSTSRTSPRSGRQPLSRSSSSCPTDSNITHHSRASISTPLPELTPTTHLAWT